MGTRCELQRTSHCVRSSAYSAKQLVRNQMRNLGMNKRILLAFILSIIGLGIFTSALQAQQIDGKKTAPDFRAGQLLFEANRGQAPSDVRFLARSRGFNLYLTDTGAMIQLQERSGPEPVNVA